ncbi:hypothetical protein [Methyloferula stellata]|uniref:hypothetical protein n=1 Tax=Methyloferula stellata TaxID=876270 RepID=UPI0012692161
MMEAIGRVFLVLAGMAAAIATAFLVLPLLVLFDPLGGGASLVASIGGFIDLLGRNADDLPPDQAVSLFAGFFWWAALMICVVPVVVTALIGEVASVRSLVWYGGAAGGLAAAMPWLMRAAFHLADARSATQLELRLALLFFLTGTAAGFIYWLICGRRAGLRSTLARAGTPPPLP